LSAFITVEGIEGSGKTSVISRVADDVRALTSEVVITREPGATVIGKSIRQILLDPANDALSPRAELLLFLADRAQHVAEVIRPALARGALVLCDRFIHSTLAYQGYGRKLPLPMLELLNSVATDDLRPDLVLLLDVEPEAGLGRVAERSASAHPSALDWNRFEESELDFHRAVRSGFLEMAKNPANNIVVITAAQPLGEVITAANRAVRALLKAKGAK
jgi:dTMP kinase